jgi:glutamate N-acetyltransferase/amino-acid N-acetyltransferase
MDLAEKIILDGEGTTKIIDLNISGLADDDLARKIGMVIINSPLVKTAIHGCDPNWGRIIAALGNADNEFGVNLDFDKLTLDLLGVRVFEHGMPTAFDKANLTSLMKRNKFINLQLDLAQSADSKPVRVLGSDLSYEYVRINAEYFT